MVGVGKHGLGKLERTDRASPPDRVWLITDGLQLTAFPVFKEQTALDGAMVHCRYWPEDSTTILGHCGGLRSSIVRRWTGCSKMRGRSFKLIPEFHLRQSALSVDDVNALDSRGLAGLARE